MYRDRNQVVLPLEIEKIIPHNDPVFKLVEICEKLDYSKLEKEYVRSWRKLNPATMFIILVYAYMRRLYSSRQIEEACKTDIQFMWILGMESAPDHSTIARFQNEKLVPVMEDLFYQLVNQLIDMNEVSYTNVFVDVKLMEDMIIDMYRTITETPIDIYSEENYAYHNSWALLRTKRKVLKLEKDADVEMWEYISKIMKPHYVYKILRDIIGTSTGTNGYGYYINENSLKSFFTDENVLSDCLQLCPPSDEIEKFICDIFNKYKNEEVDEMEEKAIYVDHYIRLCKYLKIFFISIPCCSLTKIRVKLKLPNRTG